MAENPILDGGEEAVAEARGAEGAVGEAVAVKLALDQAGRDPEVARAATAYLKAQTAEIEALHVARMAAAEESSREGRLRRFGMILRNGAFLIIAAITGLLGIGFLIMLHDAFASQAVVVEVFKAPQALAGRGLTGDVVAEGVLDDLQKMQAATRSATGHLETRGAWASDVKVEVPDTGVSVGEIDRLLHQRFGHDIHIGGDLLQTDTGGLALTVRGDHVPAATFTGGPGDLDKLTMQAAEHVYGQSQPFRYGAFLESQNRYAEAIPFLENAFPRAASDEERTSLANTWGNAHISLLQPDKAAEKYRMAMSFARPRSQDWWKPWGNLIGALSISNEEAGWRESHAFLAAAAAAPKNQQPDMRLFGSSALTTWDFPLLLVAYKGDAALNGGAGASTTIASPSIADVYGLMHDHVQAARYIALSDPQDPTTRQEVLLLQGYAAVDRADPASAILPLEAFSKAWEADPGLQFAYTYGPCVTALAQGMAGRLKDAAASFAMVSSHFGVQSICAAFQGDVLAHAGDVAGAQRIWAEALKAAPDLPAVPLHRGLFELGRGNLKAAEADIARAATKAPHWADPWKAWGDVLAREGRWKDALAKYDEALKYAPAWTALHQARDAAARHGG